MCFKFFKFPWFQKLKGSSASSLDTDKGNRGLCPLPDLRKSWNPSQMALEKNLPSWGLCWGKVMPKPCLLEEDRRSASLADTTLPQSWLEKQGRVCKAWVVPEGSQAAGLQQHILVSVVSHKCNPWLAVSPNSSRDLLLPDESLNLIWIIGLDTDRSQRWWTILSGFSNKRDVPGFCCWQQTSTTSTCPFLHLA